VRCGSNDIVKNTQKKENYEIKVGKNGRRKKRKTTLS
tara:strand:+ start:31 stop:141 length:111 start_codon:yes stop_codon:yes gene_type:complete